MTVTLTKADPSDARPGILRKPIPPEHLVLKDGTKATLFGIKDPDTAPKGLVQFMFEEVNREIDRGQTYPQDQEYPDLASFKAYWFATFAVVLVTGHHSELDQSPTVDWSQALLGTFYMKSNFLGRFSHICNAGFVVNANFRGKGIGKVMGRCVVDWAPHLGFTYIMYNLVFSNNEASIRCWEGLGFERIGLIRDAGYLKGQTEPVDAIMFGKNLLKG